MNVPKAFLYFENWIGLVTFYINNIVSMYLTFHEKNNYLLHLVKMQAHKKQEFFFNKCLHPMFSQKKLLTFVRSFKTYAKVLKILTNVNSFFLYLQEYSGWLRGLIHKIVDFMPWKRRYLVSTIANCFCYNLYDDLNIYWKYIGTWMSCIVHFHPVLQSYDGCFVWLHKYFFNP